MTNIDEMSINAIRVLSADAIQKANSGHPGLPLGTAPTAYELWTNHMNYNPADPEWENRDRFVLSGGHGSMLLYSLFHLLGIGNLSLDDVLLHMSATLRRARHNRVAQFLGTLYRKAPANLSVWHNLSSRVLSVITH